MAFSLPNASPRSAQNRAGAEITPAVTGAKAILRCCAGGAPEIDPAGPSVLQMAMGDCADTAEDHPAWLAMPAHPHLLRFHVAPPRAGRTSEGGLGRSLR